MKTALTKKYGPLPIWGWGIIVVVVLYAGMKILQNRSNKAAATNPAGTLSTDASNYYPNNGAGGGGFSLPDSLPNTVVGQSTQYVQADTPTDTGGETPSPLASAPITAFDSPPSPVVVTDPNDGSVNVTQSGVTDDGSVVTGLGPPVIPGAGMTTTQKILPEPIESLPANRATIGKAVAS